MVSELSQIRSKNMDFNCFSNLKDCVVKKGHKTLSPRVSQRNALLAAEESGCDRRSIFLLGESQTIAGGLFHLHMNIKRFLYTYIGFLWPYIKYIVSVCH